MLRTSTTQFLKQASVLNRSNRLFSTAAIALVNTRFNLSYVCVPDSFYLFSKNSVLNVIPLVIFKFPLISIGVVKLKGKN